MDFFDHNDYREALKALVKTRKRTHPGFGFHSLADAARIQRPYMSKVISGKADLSLDQLFLICNSMDLDSEQRTFLELLLNYSRTSVALRKRHLRKQIDDISESKRSTSANLKSKTINSEATGNLSTYYLKPWVQITHAALSIPRYAKEPKLLAQALGLSGEEMQGIIKDLVGMQLVEFKDEMYVLTDTGINLSRSSPIYNAWKTQVRLAGAHRQTQLSEANSYTFTAYFSATEQERKQLHTKFLAYLKEFESIVNAAECRNVYQMSFDLFPWL